MQDIPLKSRQEKIEDGIAKTIHHTIDAFLIALQKGGVGHAYYAYTSFEFRKTASLKEFEDLVRRYPSLGNNRTLQMLSTSHFDNLGTLTGYAVSIEGRENIISFDVIYEVQKWRILGIQIYPSHL